MALKVIQSAPQVEAITIVERPPMMSWEGRYVYLKTNTNNQDQAEASGFWGVFGNSSYESLGYQYTAHAGTILTTKTERYTIAEVTGGAEGTITHLLGALCNSIVAGVTYTKFIVTTSEGIFEYKYLHKSNYTRICLGAYMSGGVITAGVSEEGQSYYRVDNSMYLVGMAQSVREGLGIPHNGNYKIEVEYSEGAWSIASYSKYSGAAALVGTSPKKSFN